MERRNELLGSQIATVLSSRLEIEPDDPALFFYASLLGLARMNSAVLVLGALPAPDETPRRLTELAHAAAPHSPNSGA
ncbi:MAG: hypothetical protein EOM91_14225 [Sphingobacteriia bacterium]|nr:hypothetical protein [Sphingobacteriia bacterium]